MKTFVQKEDLNDARESKNFQKAEKVKKEWNKVFEGQKEMRKNQMTRKWKKRERLAH